MARWFRFYEDALNDPKVQKLPAPLFKAWVNLLCLASRNGGHVGTLEEIAFGLRMGPKEAARVVNDLCDAGLLDMPSEGAFEPHNWHGRQYSSDSSAERMRRHRERKRDDNKPSLVTASDRHMQRHSDAADTEQTQIQNRTEQNRAESASPAAPPASQPPDIPPFLDRRGSRLTLDALPDDWRAYCIENHRVLSPEAMWQEFRDYWIAQPGAKGRKADWKATWRTWLRRSSEFKRGPNGQHKPSDLDNRRSLADAFDEVAAEAEARAGRVGT